MCELHIDAAPGATTTVLCQEWPLLVPPGGLASSPEAARAFEAYWATAKIHWTRCIQRTGESAAGRRRIIDWIVGESPPPCVVRTQVDAQRERMMDAMERQGHLPDPLLYPAVTGTPRNRGYRSFERQADIWEGKYDFVEGEPFDRVTQGAVDACAGVATLTEDAKWHRDSEEHRRCWAHLLDRHPDRIEHQILQASAAPGTSRHHWGTDFDMFSLTSSEWSRSPLSDAHRWLEQNASLYGFSQPYCEPSHHGRVDSWGYMEEKWHWSFYPIAEAIMEFTSAHKDEIGERIRGLWDERDRQRSRARKPSAYRFIRDHWYSYVINVSRDLR